MRLIAFFAFTGSGALTYLSPEAASARWFFKAQQGMAEAVLVRNQHQRLGGHAPVTEKSVQLGPVANFCRVDDLQHTVANS